MVTNKEDGLPVVTNILLKTCEPLCMHSICYTARLLPMLTKCQTSVFNYTITQFDDQHSLETELNAIVC